VARGVRYLKTKTIVKLAALEMFLGDFESPDELIGALVDMTEFAVTHPAFGTPGYPGDDEYFWADEATDALITFFQTEFCVEEDATGAPPVVVNYETGAIELLKRRYRPRRPREPSLAAATREVPVKLAGRPGAEN
jgi:hypothetical protein